MQPLSGVVVLDFSTTLPGPLATLMLAEAGADVTKIEPPAGDSMRGYWPQWGADSAIFAMLNRGKKSLALDLKDKVAVAHVLEMVAHADIVVEQFRPGVMARLGLGYEALSAINPKLIYCSITGYGQTGPRAPHAGHDLNYVGDTGFLALSMGEATDTVLPAAPIGDIGGGTYPAVVNILLALEERRRTGHGRHIDIAMSENVFTFAYWALAAGFGGGAWPKEGGHMVTGNSPRYRVYATRDGKGLVVAALEEKFWATFCDTIGLDKALRDDANNPSATAQTIAGIIASADAAEWSYRLAGKDCCVTLLTDLETAVRDPHFAARGVFDAQVANEAGGEMPALPIPIAREFRVSPDGVLSSPALGVANGQATEAAE